MLSVLGAIYVCCRSVNSSTDYVAYFRKYPHDSQRQVCTGNGIKLQLLQNKETPLATSTLYNKYVII